MKRCVLVLLVIVGFLACVSTDSPGGGATTTVSAAGRATDACSNLQDAYNNFSADYDQANAEYNVDAEVFLPAETPGTPEYDSTVADMNNQLDNMYHYGNLMDGVQAQAQQAHCAWAI